MALQFRAFAALLEDPGLFPTTYNSAKEANVFRTPQVPAPTCVNTQTQAHTPMCVIKKEKPQILLSNVEFCSTMENGQKKSFNK